MSYIDDEIECSVIDTKFLDKKCLSQFPKGNRSYKTKDLPFLGYGTDKSISGRLVSKFSEIDMLYKTQESKLDW